MIGTDSSPLESPWWNRVSFRKLKMGTIIMLCIPSHLIFLYLYLGSPTFCSEQSCGCSGTVTRDLWLWEQPQLLALWGHLQVKMFVGTGTSPLEGVFWFCCLYFWSSVWLPSVGKDLSVSENRLRQCLSLKWTLVNLLVICKIAVAMPTRGPVKKLWVTQSLDLVLCCLQGCSVVGR